MVRRFDHVGVVVQNSEEMIALLSRLFGFEISETLMQSEAGFRSTTVSKQDVSFELMEPIGPDGIVQRFLEKRGGGMHHVSIQVDDLDAEMKRLKEMGVQFTSEQPTYIDRDKVAFIHPRSMNGLLVELMQRGSKAK